MSHEIRGPIGAILAASERLSDGTPSSPGIDPVEIIRRTARHLVDLVNVTLDLSKIEAGCLELAVASIDPDEGVEEAVMTHALAAAAKGLHVEVTRREDAPPRVALDPMRYRQILASLIGNAVKFTDPGGRVQVVVGRTAGEGRQLR